MQSLRRLSGLSISSVLSLSSIAVSLLAGVAACGDDPQPIEGKTPAAQVTSGVTSGTLRRWPEAVSRLNVDFTSDGPSVRIGAARPAGLDAFWSIASTGDGASGFFYGDMFRSEPETRVARSSAAHVREIRDAAALDFTDRSVGPVPIGSIVVFEHRPTERYLAIVIDAIEAADPRTAGPGPYAYADVRWYLTDEGSGDFSAAP